MAAMPPRGNVRCVGIGVDQIEEVPQMRDVNMPTFEGIIHDKEARDVSPNALVFEDFNFAAYYNTQGGKRKGRTNHYLAQSLGGEAGDYSE